MVTHRRSAPQRPSRVVILGSSGFVGGALNRHLAASGFDTCGLSSAQVDLGSPEAVEALQRIVQPEDALIVTSALTPDKGRDVRTLMKNLAMGEQLSAFLERSPCAHVVYVSSDAVYADGVSLVREDSCASPSTFHGLMHLVRERMLIQALAASKTPLAILRPCALYGMGDTHNGYGPNRFIRSAMRERTIALFGQGEEQRDHLYIDDLSRMIGLCLEQQRTGVLNIATGRSISFAALAKQITHLSDAPVEIRTSARQTPVTHRHFDTSALVRAFPRFQPTPLGEGLAQTLAALNQHAAVTR